MNFNPGSYLFLVITIILLFSCMKIYLDYQFFPCLLHININLNALIYVLMKNK